LISSNFDSSGRTDIPVRHNQTRTQADRNVRSPRFNEESDFLKILRKLRYAKSELFN